MVESFIINEAIFSDWNDEHTESKQYSKALDYIRSKNMVPISAAAVNVDFQFGLVGALGSVEDCEKLLSSNIRNLFYESNILDYNRVMLNVPCYHLLNPVGFFLPFGTIKQNYTNFIKRFREDGIFIRPNSQTKPFTGQTIDYCNWYFNVEQLRNTYKLTDDEWVYVDRKKKIHDTEYRFWIANKKIVTYTPYSHVQNFTYRAVNNKLCNIAVEFVQELMNKNLVNVPEMDYYVLDVGFEMDDKNLLPSVIELNNWSSSGIYNGEIEKIIEAMLEVE